MKKIYHFLSVVFSFCILLELNSFGIREFLGSNISYNDACLYIDGNKFYIDTCKDIDSKASQLYLVSNPKESTLENKKNDGYYKLRFEDFDFYLICPNCAKKYFLDVIDADLSPEDSRNRVLCEKIFRDFTAIHAITCSHECENCGKIFELYSAWLLPFRFIDFISKSNEECSKHAITKFALHKGFPDKEENGKYKFFNVFVERFPKSPGTVKSLYVEFPIE